MKNGLFIYSIKNELISPDSFLFWNNQMEFIRRFSEQKHISPLLAFNIKKLIEIIERCNKFEIDYKLTHDELLDGHIVSITIPIPDQITITLNLFNTKSFSINVYTKHGAIADFICVNDKSTNNLSPIAILDPIHTKEKPFEWFVISRYL